MELCRLGVLYFLLWWTAIVKECCGGAEDGSGVSTLVPHQVSPTHSQEDETLTPTATSDYYDFLTPSPLIIQSTQQADLPLTTSGSTSAVSSSFAVTQSLTLQPSTSLPLSTTTTAIPPSATTGSTTSISSSLSPSVESITLSSTVPHLTTREQPSPTVPVSTVVVPVSSNRETPGSSRTAFVTSTSPFSSTSLLITPTRATTTTNNMEATPTTRGNDIEATPTTGGTDIEATPTSTEATPTTGGNDIEATPTSTEATPTTGGNDLEATPTTGRNDLEATPTTVFSSVVSSARRSNTETTPTNEPTPATPTDGLETTPPATPTPSNEPTSSGQDSLIDKIRLFFEKDLQKRPELLIAVILGPVAVILLVVLVCVGCCCLRSSRKKNKKFNLAQTSASRNGGLNATYRPRSRASVHEMKHYDTDAFCNSDFTYQTASQPYHTMMGTSSDAFLDPLPSISPLSYPSQLRNYLTSPEKREHPSSPTPRISLSESPSRMRRYPGSSPSLTRPTPLGQQLQKQAERNSTQGSRTSIQGSRASISAMGSRTSFSESRNSFLSNTTSRDETRSSGFLASTKTMSEGETGSQTSYRPLMRQTSLDMVPTRESPVQLPPAQQLAGNRREYKSLTCISNPVALRAEGETEAREEGDGVDENDLRKDPLVPILTSTPVGQAVDDDVPTKEAKQHRKKVEGSWKAGESLSFASPRKKTLQQLTSLTLPESDEREGSENTGEQGAEGGGDKENLKNDKGPGKPMSRLEKLTSLNYIRSSIRRSLKKKRVSFLTRTPDSTPKAKKKTPPQTLPMAEPDLDPDPLTFSNQAALDAEGPMLSPRIHTPSPLSPEFEGVDDYPQRYTDNFYNPDIYPETHTLRNPYPGVGGGGGSRMRSYSDIPMFAPQLSQPTYYPSTMHYPQPSYPQLSQQYVPPSYGPPLQPLIGSPSHRGFGPLSVQPTFQQPVVGSPPHHNLGPLSQPLVGSPTHHGGGPFSIPPQPLVGSPPHHNPGPFSLPPQPLVGSPPHRTLGPLSMYPSLHPGLPPEPHGRRYTDSSVGTRGRGRGGNDPRDSRRSNRARSPDTYTDTASNVSSRYDRGISPDRFTETSYTSEVPTPSPDILYSALLHSARDGYLDPPLRYRGIPTSPEESPYSPQFYSNQGGTHSYGGGGEKPYRGHPPAQHYSERSVDNPKVRSDSYYRPGGHDSQTQSPAHKSYNAHKQRRSSLDHQSGHHSRHGSSDTPSHSRHGSSDTPSHSRHGSSDGTNRSRRGSVETPSHSRHGSSDGTNRSRRGSVETPSHSRHGSSDNTTTHNRRGSTDATPSHSRQGSHDTTGSRVQRSSIENQPTGHTHRGSVENHQGANTRGSHTVSGERRSSVDGKAPGSRKRTSLEGHPQPRHSAGFHPILEPRQRNGMGAEGVWQHSQIEEEMNEYGIGSQCMGWEDLDATPTEHGTGVQRAADSTASGAKAKVSWSNEIIEHLRTPSDSSEPYDL